LFILASLKDDDDI